jgi:hypothetical protein
MSQSGTGRLLILVTLAAILALYLPWNWHQNASLSPNLHDLAEWISLFPQSQAQNPPLAGSLLLRGAVVLLAVLIAMQVSRPGSRLSPRVVLVCLLAAIGLSLTLLPPLDFLSDLDNLNYRQQLLAAGVAWGGIVGLVAVGRRLPVRLWDGLGLLFALAAIGLATSGLVMAQTPFSTLRVSLAVGAGAVGFIGLQCIQAGVYGRRLLRRSQ